MRPAPRPRTSSRCAEVPTNLGIGLSLLGITVEGPSEQEAEAERITETGDERVIEAGDVRVTES